MKRSSAATPAPRDRRKGPRDAAATREALLAAASALFAERGLEGVRVDAVARQARANKAMINYHFGGKRGLYEATLTGTFEEIVPRVAALAASTDPPPDVLREFVRQFGELGRRHPEFPVLMMRELLAGDPRTGALVLPYLLRVIGAVRAIVERGMAEGHFRRVDPVATHLGMVGMLVFFFATDPFRQRLARQAPLPLRFPTPDEFVAHVTELMLRGLAAETVPAEKPARRRR